MRRVDQEGFSRDWVLRVEAPGSIAAALEAPWDRFERPLGPLDGEPGILVLAGGRGSAPRGLCARLASWARGQGEALRFVPDAGGRLEADARTGALLDAMKARAETEFGPRKGGQDLARLSRPEAEPRLVPMETACTRVWILGRRKPDAGRLVESEGKAQLQDLSFRTFALSLWRIDTLSGPAARGEALRLVERAWVRLARSASEIGRNLPSA